MGLRLGRPKFVSLLRVLNAIVTLLVLGNVGKSQALAQPRFISYGELIPCELGFRVRIPCCPRCNKEHHHGMARDDELDQYGILKTNRMPHCWGEWDDCKNPDYDHETTIVVHKTSHFQSHLANQSTVQPGEKQDERGYEDDDDDEDVVMPLAAEDTILEWGSKWQGSSFLEVWEKDPNYCISISKRKTIKIPATPSMTRSRKNAAFFKEFLLEKLYSRESRIQLELVHFAGLRDFAGHMVGSSSLRPGRQGVVMAINYPSHKEQWIAETGCRWPTTCCVEGCVQQATLGAHIFVKEMESASIVCQCAIAATVVLQTISE